MNSLANLKIPINHFQFSNLMTKHMYLFLFHIHTHRDTYAHTKGLEGEAERKNYSYSYQDSETIFFREYKNYYQLVSNKDCIPVKKRK